ncbi:MAG: UbiD family decarboxylase [Candidatus Omnitrophica bacterium]|nr:UbiD family decarboxylase [Candidatus Omnitrophota bacterium]
MHAKPLTDLRGLLSILRQEGDLVEINAQVDPNQEVAEIHRRVIAANGPALFFTNVKGSPFPLVTNLFGTSRRVDIAFGRKPRQLIQRIVDFAQQEMPPKPSKLWANRDLGLELLKVGTKKRKSGPVLEVEDSHPRLTEIPWIQLWPEDGGAFNTLGLVYTREPGGGPPNLGIYRMHRYDDTRTGMHWQIGKGGGFHYKVAQERGEALPVSVILGGPPALLLSALAPLPEGVPEILLTGLLQGKKLDVVEHPSRDHTLAAEAEFILLGEVPPVEVHPEGPFGDHYGYYSLVHDYPVFHCQKILRRKDAICPATVVGKPRQEDFFLGDYLQEMLSPLFPMVMPSVVDLWSYGETGFHSLSAAVVKERYGREAMMSAFRILGEGQLSLSKFLLLTDKKQDLKDFKSVLTHILARCHWETDLFVFSNLSMDTLDYAGPEVNRGSKGVLMGLGEALRDLPKAWDGELPIGVEEIHVFSPGCLVVGGPNYESDPNFASNLAIDERLKGWQLVVLCDRPKQAAASSINFLWTAFTRFEPAADLHPSKSWVHRNHICYEAPVVLDARIKPWYPKEVFCDPDIAKLVERRWREYFPEGKVEMGSSDLGHLTPDL